jgi:hypothetical protein
MRQGFRLQIITAICFSLALSPFFVSAATPSKDFINRQQSFYKVMELSNAELQNLNTTLNNLKIDNNNDKSEEMNQYTQEKAEFLKTISQFEVYNRDTKDKISKTKDIAGLKSLAVEFKNWRENIYNPQAQIIVNFSLLLQQKTILDTANDRLNKVQQDVKKLENLGIDQINKLNSLLYKAKINLDEANQSFEKAKTIFNTYFNSATSTMATATEEIATSTENATSTINIEVTQKQIDIPQLQTLLEDGFTKIKSVYETFIEMSSVVKKL